jgi:hypothetical protein
VKARFQFVGLGVLLMCLAGCSQSGDHRQTREAVAKATERAKPEIQWTAHKAGQAGRWFGEQTMAAVEGFFEGWYRKDLAVDLNSASLRELQELPGVTQEDARQIVRGRPYEDPNQLISKGIVSRSVYRKIRDQVTVRRSAS